MYLKGGKKILFDFLAVQSRQAPACRVKKQSHDSLHADMEVGGAWFLDGRIENDRS